MNKALFSPKKSYTEITIEKLKQRTNSVYIYGSTSTAKQAYKLLSDNGILVHGFFVDDKYFSSTDKNIPLYSYSQVMNMKNVDIVIGFYQFGIAYEKIKNKLINNDGEVFFISRGLLFDYDYYLENKALFEETYNLFEDDLSKQTMEAYMDGRMNGVMYPLYECHTPNQYFIPEIQLNDKEVFIDCGMYDGDTIDLFISRCNSFDSIIGFEPDKKNIDNFYKRNLKGNIKVINKGVWSKDDTLYFVSEGTTSSRFSEKGDSKICVTSIDSLNLSKPVTFIKMDIEGSELEALKGAQNTIKQYYPKLAICVYHKKEDLITIPQYIKSLDQGGRKYKFILRHHSLCEHETVLYAIPND